MLERSGSRQTCSTLELTNELPRVESIEQIDITWASIEHCDRKLLIALHENSRRLLIRITAVFEFQFDHYNIKCEIFRRKDNQIRIEIQTFIL